MTEKRLQHCRQHGPLAAAGTLANGPQPLDLNSVQNFLPGLLACCPLRQDHDAVATAVQKRREALGRGFGTAENRTVVGGHDGDAGASHGINSRATAQ